VSGSKNRTFDFVLNNSNFQFNNIAADRSGTNISSAVLGPTKKEAASTLTANLGYSQSASGLYLKISFPNLRNLLQRPDYTKIISAQLIIKPVPSSYNGQFTLPPQLVAATTDVLNEPGGVLTATSGGTAVTQTGNLFIDLDTQCVPGAPTQTGERDVILVVCAVEACVNN